MKLLLVDIVGLTSRLIGDRTPNLSALAQRGAFAPMTTVFPAVTCSAQATMLTGLSPSAHGAVGNGWLDRASGEVALWRQSNALVAGEKLYEAAKRQDPDCTVAKIFWWWNLGAQVDWSITPRPFYPADGRKIPAVYSQPTEYGADLERVVGPFPFFDFWGPKSGLPSSRWLADAAIRTLATRSPTLTLLYLPHLDYDFQRFGPDDPRSRKAVQDVDAILGDLVREADRTGTEILVVSEYGIVAVDTPIEINRALRKAGLLVVRDTPAGEILDTHASRAFALADHQVAHVYTHRPEDAERADVVVRALPGVERVLSGEEKRAVGLDHPRAGDLVVVAKREAWFSYPYWLHDSAAPDFARTVDIHRKPGYDPCELFLDPKIPLPNLRIAARLLQKSLGFRYLMDVIPLDAHLVRGSHGRLPDDPRDGPVFLCSRPFGPEGGECGPEPRDGAVEMTSVKDRVVALLRAR
jgi:predicted AlkP superfamily pyrophosphatase or phosphodiesterase